MPKTLKALLTLFIGITALVGGTAEAGCWDRLKREYELTFTPRIAARRRQAEQRADFRQKVNGAILEGLERGVLQDAMAILGRMPFSQEPFSQEKNLRIGTDLAGVLPFYNFAYDARERQMGRPGIDKESRRECLVNFAGKFDNATLWNSLVGPVSEDFLYRFIIAQTTFPPEGSSWRAP